MDLDWGHYLCRGPSMTDGDFLNRLENFLCEKELLSTFSSRVAVGYFAKYLEADPQSMRHILPYYSANVSNKRIAPCADAQGGCPGIVPGLRAKPFWNDLEKFSWVQKLEDSFQDIKEEFINLRASTSGGFQPYRAPPSGDKRKFVDLLGEVATKTGEWNVCYLYLHGMDFEMNRKACPITSMLIQSIPRQYNHALFSALAPQTHVRAHYGPTNRKLRCHLPLLVPSVEGGPCCFITVAGKRVPMLEGKCLLFDDSFLHEAENNSEERPRVVLIVDVWHPDLTDEEVKFLSFVDNAKFKNMRKLEAALQEKMTSISDEKVQLSTFSSVISANANGSNIAINPEVIWGLNL